MVDHIDSSRCCGICCATNFAAHERRTLYNPPHTNCKYTALHTFTPTSWILPNGTDALKAGKHYIRKNYDNMQVHPQRLHLPHRLCPSPRSPFKSMAFDANANAYPTLPPPTLLPSADWHQVDQHHRYLFPRKTVVVLFSNAISISSDIPIQNSLNPASH